MPLIGDGGSIQIASAVYPVAEWSLSTSNDLQDITDTGANGWVVRLKGISDASVTFRAYWGRGAADLAVTFEAGTAGVLTLPIGNSGQSYNVPGLIRSTTVNNATKTAVDFSCQLDQSGGITFDTGD